MSWNQRRQPPRGYAEYDMPRNANEFGPPRGSPYLTSQYGNEKYEYRPMTEKEALQEFTRQMPDTMPPSEIYDQWLALKQRQQEEEEEAYYQQGDLDPRQRGRPQTARWEPPIANQYAASNYRKTGTLPKGGGGKDLIDSRGKWADRPRGSDFPPGPPPPGYYSPPTKQMTAPEGMVRSREMREGFSSHPVGEVVSYLDVSPRATSEYNGLASHQISTSKQYQASGAGLTKASSAFQPDVSHLSRQSGGYYDYGRPQVPPHSDRHHNRQYAQTAPAHVFDSGYSSQQYPAQNRPTFHESYEKKMQQRMRVKAAQQGHYTATKQAFSNPRPRPQSAALASMARPQQALRQPLRTSYHDEGYEYNQNQHLDPRFDLSESPYYEEQYPAEERPPLSSYARDAYYSKQDDPSQIGHSKNIVPQRASAEFFAQSDAATDAGSQVRRMRVMEQEANRSMSAKDLERARGNALGSHAVPGSPNVRLIGGQWKAVTQEIKEGKPLWTDYYGPHGGGKEKVLYYGRKWSAGGRETS